jgi:suppressor for copper-sensitivity B
MKFRPLVALALAILTFNCWSLPAQDQVSDPAKPPASITGILDQLGGANLGAAGQEMKLTGEYRVARGSRNGRLSVRAELLPEWHTYSMTQKAGAGQPAQIIVASSNEYRLTRPFVADRVAHAVDEKVFPVLSELHEDEVKFAGQVCHAEQGCIPILKQPVPVKFAGEYDSPAVGQFQPKLIHAKVSGEIAPRTVTPGSVVKLRISAEPQKGYHVYAYAQRDPNKVSKPTLITWKNDQGWKRSAVTASDKPVEYQTELKEEPIQYYHEKKVTWTIDLQVPPDVTPGGYELQGLLGIQTCTSKGCDPPTGAEFRVVVEVAKLKAEPSPEPLSFVSADYKQAATLAAADTVVTPTIAQTDVNRAPPSDQAASQTAQDSKTSKSLNLEEFKPLDAASKNQSILIVLPTALLAGLLLNFMPCVLPVIGLKIVSFVQQSGENRSRVFMLNLWYALGVLSVFMVLASLAVFAGFSWGDQFRSPTFNVVLACVVFAFALSFLGVWEIPLPGFVGSSGASAAAEKEGATGAFFKGALSTVLATPCGGPLLAPALTWAVAQPPLTAYLGFAFVGLGMASPYLLVGAYPKLMAFLPKPGEWMETFKHIMGFVLMGTVVFVLTVIPISLVVPTVAMMIGLWASLWWVGRVPVWEDLNKRVRAWAGGAAFATLIGFVSYMWLDDVMASRLERDIDRALATRMSQNVSSTTVAPSGGHGTELPWQPYSHDLLAELIAKKQTVFVDFTADWCLLCQANAKVALDVAETKAFVEANGVAVLKADMTTEARDADELKASLGGASVAIPYYAVFPAADPKQPIVFDGPITKSRVIDTLKKAIAKGSTATAEVADNRK